MSSPIDRINRHVNRAPLGDYGTETDERRRRLVEGLLFELGRAGSAGAVLNEIHANPLDYGRTLQDYEDARSAYFGEEG